METNIIRNCIHHSSVQTGLELDDAGNPSAVIRKSFAVEGVESIRREVDALKWYCHQLNLDYREAILTFEGDDGYAFLRLKYYQGKLGDYYLPITKNYTKCANLIDYYKAVFLEHSDAPVHGDLSLGNVVYKNQEVTWVIDWENANKVMPREYDLIYCITENCLFRVLLHKQLSSDEIETYQRLLKMIQERMPIDKEILSGPAGWCKRQAIAYMEKTGVRHQKCPFIAVDEAVVEKCNELLVLKEAI